MEIQNADSAPNVTTQTAPVSPTNSPPPLQANLLNALEEEARLLNNDEEEKKQEKDGAPQHEPAATATATAETLAPVPAPFVPDGAKPFDLETETLLLLPRALDAGYRGGGALLVFGWLHCTDAVRFFP